MAGPGPHNDITDVAGILAGHYTDRQHVSGVTAVLAPGGAVGGVDVRGSAPGTRETDLLSPQNLVERVNAVLLCGGSVYGLAAADGAVRWLAGRGQGFPLAEGQVAPIVPAAALFDLGRGPEFVPPVGPEWGRRACAAAGDGPLALGCEGAGTGALAGGVKGGVGSASLVLDNGLTAGAVVAVNSLGSVIDPGTGLFWEAAHAIGGELGPAAARPVALPPPPGAEPAKNTTIAVVATDAKLTKAQAQKLAAMAHDGMGRAIRPAHTMFDGDTIFCLGSGKRGLPETEGFFAAPHAVAINELGAALADCLARAIMRAVAMATSLAGMTALSELPPR